MPEPIDFGTQVCPHCGVLEVFHDREHVATECLPKQMEKQDALIEETWNCLNDWTGDHRMSDEEKERFCDLWQKIGDHLKKWNTGPTNNPQA